MDAHNQTTADAEPIGVWFDDEAWFEASIPKRPWVVKGYLMRGSVTVVVGPPSTMKSSLMLSWACAAALVRDHGRFHPHEAVRSIVYNVEDDKNEQRRRLAAVVRQFDAKPADLRDKVICTGPNGVGTLLERGQDGIVDPSLAMSQIRLRLDQAKAEGNPFSILIVDPLAELHNAEENDNTALRSIVAQFRSLAVTYKIAVVVVHHTRKGASASPGDPDIARGASSIIGAARIVVTLTGMSEEDAKALGMPADQKSRSHFIRLDDGKQNYAPIGEAAWFEKTVYELDNGEHVPAAVPWSPPVDLVSLETLTAIEAGIALGCGGEPWATQGPGERDIKKLFVKHGVCTLEGQAKVKQHLVRVGIEVSVYQKKGGNRIKAKGYRTKDGQPAGVEWADG